MYIKTENELNQLVRIAWNLGLATGNCDRSKACVVMFDAICSHLNVTGWSSNKGIWSRDTSPTEIIWTKFKCSSLFPRGSQHLSTNLHLGEWIENALDQNAMVETFSSSDFNVHQDTQDPWHYLVHLTVFAEGTIECVTFVKPSHMDAFSDLERTFVDAMLANLNGVFEQEPKAEMDTDARMDLPKRQREVLELLLQGASLKEIAAELRISRHTVNDYSKSLYRHFDVSGRAELAAIFRDSAQLTLSHAESKS